MCGFLWWISRNYLDNSLKFRQVFATAAEWQRLTGKNNLPSLILVDVTTQNEQGLHILEVTFLQRCRSI